MHTSYISQVEETNGHLCPLSRVQNCESVIRGLERAVKSAQDILDYQIDPTLAAMERCKFVRFPDQPEMHLYELPSGRGNPAILTTASPALTSAATSAGVASSGASVVSARASASAAFYLQSRREPGVGWSLGEFIRTTIEQANNAAALLQQLSQIVFEAAEAYATTALTDFDAFVKSFGERYHKEGTEISSTINTGELCTLTYTLPTLQMRDIPTAHLSPTSQMRFVISCMGRTKHTMSFD